MNSVKSIFFDKKQVAELVAALKKPRPSSMSLDNLLRFIQALAVIAAGCWVIFQYLSFQRHADTNTLEQQKLAVEQAHITLKTKEEAEATALEQQKLGVQQAQIGLKTQEASDKAALEQRKLAIQQATISLQTQQSQKELRQQELAYSVMLKEQEAELNRQKQQLGKLEIDDKTTYRFTREFDLGVQKIKDEGDNFAQYEVSMKFSLTNNADPMYEISLFVHDYYVGTPRESPPGSSTYLLPTGGPPNRWNPNSGNDGWVKWEKIHSWGSLAGVAEYDLQHMISSLFRDVPFTPGVGTGDWKKGETMSFLQTYILRAPRNAYFAIEVAVCFNRGAKQEDLYRISRIANLADAEEVNEAVAK